MIAAFRQCARRMLIAGVTLVVLASQQSASAQMSLADLSAALVHDEVPASEDLVGQFPPGGGSYIFCDSFGYIWGLTFTVCPSVTSGYCVDGERQGNSICGTTPTFPVHGTLSADFRTLTVMSVDYPEDTCVSAGWRVARVEGRGLFFGEAQNPSSTFPDLALGLCFFPSDTAAAGPARNSAHSFDPMESLPGQSPLSLPNAVPQDITPKHRFPSVGPPTEIPSPTPLPDSDLSSAIPVTLHDSLGESYELTLTPCMESPGGYCVDGTRTTSGLPCAHSPFAKIVGTFQDGVLTLAVLNGVVGTTIDTCPALFIRASLSDPFTCVGEIIDSYSTVMPIVVGM